MVCAELNLPRIVLSKSYKLAMTSKCLYKLVKTNMCCKKVTATATSVSKLCVKSNRMTVHTHSHEPMRLYIHEHFLLLTTHLLSMHPRLPRLSMHQCPHFQMSWRIDVFIHCMCVHRLQTSRTRLVSHFTVLVAIGLCKSRACLRKSRSHKSRTPETMQQVRQLYRNWVGKHCIWHPVLQLCGSDGRHRVTWVQKAHKRFLPVELRVDNNHQNGGSVGPGRRMLVEENCSSVVEFQQHNSNWFDQSFAVWVVELLVRVQNRCCS